MKVKELSRNLKQIFYCSKYKSFRNKIPKKTIQLNMKALDIIKQKIQIRAFQSKKG